MSERLNPATLAEVRREVRVAHLADVLDARGFRNQCLSPSPGPLHPRMRCVGRAFTVVTEKIKVAPDKPYVGLLEALDSLAADDIYVIPSLGEFRAALWGELLTNRALAVGAAGIVTDGAVRDIDQILALEFPTFCAGSTPRDIHGRYEVIGTGRQIEVGGVLVSHGDLLAADIDGVVVVPPEVEVEIAQAALAKARAESTMIVDLRNGMLPSEAFALHKVL